MKEQLTAVEYLSYVYALQGAIYQDDIDKALEMEREQHEYEWDNCKKIIHEGFVYVKYNDLIQCKKSLNNCT
jgi:hypothetical protein